MQPAFPPVIQPAGPAPSWAPTFETAGNMFARLGFWVLCGYMISAVLNDWAFRILGTKGYLSVITVVALPLVWLMCGSTFRGLKHPIGWGMAGFLIWMLVDVPFSVWRGGSFQLLVNYIPRSYMLYFYIAALAVSVRKCRQFMYVNIIVSFLVLISCAIFGKYSDDGRYYLPGGAGLFGNANDLALQLLLGVTQFAYLFAQKGRIGKFLAVPGIAVSLVYMTRTGSRAALLAAIAYGIAVWYFSQRRVLVVAFAGVLLTGALLTAPTGALNRLSLLVADEKAPTNAQASAMASQASRIALLKRSLWVTATHPLFGVGPGQFAVSMADEAKEKGEWADWLGTHNSYTEVSSECGIPAFICYLAALIGALGLNVRVWKKFRYRRDGADVTTLSIALMSGLIVYATCSLFFHMAYGGSLPFYAGQTVALAFAVQKDIKAG